MKIHHLPDSDLALPSTCEVGLIGDAHRGVRHSDRKRWLEALRWVRAGKNRRVFLMGDLLDGIPSNDRRYDHAVIDPLMPDVMTQKHVVADELAPIADRILGLLNSNHSFVPGVRAVGEIDKDFVLTLEKQTGVRVPMLTYESVVVLDEEAKHKWFLSHGFGHINSSHLDEGMRRSQMEARLRMKLIRKPGMGRLDHTSYDLKAMGHTHKLLVRKPQLIQGPEIYPVRREDGAWRLGGDYAHDDPTYYVNTGSFLRLWVEGISGYGGMAGYDPVDMGFAIVKVRDNRVMDVEARVLG